jgi:shikimate kinase
VKLALVGMPGSGKTTIGRGLALKLGLSFVDSDQEIELKTGATISTIFELEGEIGFRKREAFFIDEISQRSSIVLSTGGGAILAAGTRQLLHERMVVIYLDAKVDDLVRRTRHDKSRPLLQTPDLKSRLTQLAADRDGLYRETAHIIVETSRQSSANLISSLLDRLGKSSAEHHCS